ncbi:MAG: hypothetical protein R3C45_03085 [Phycisphaerales bacterium]
MALIRRVMGLIGPHKRSGDVLLAICVLRAIQLPAAGRRSAAAIKGPITDHDYAGMWLYAAGFVLLAAFTSLTFHFRQRYGLELGEVVVYELREETGSSSTFSRCRCGFSTGRSWGGSSAG